MSIKWFELQLLCWECSGASTPYASIEEVVYELADNPYDYKPIQVCIINPDGLPMIYDKIEWRDCYLKDIDPSDYQIGGMLASSAYSYQDDEGDEKVIFLFNKIGW